MSGSAAPVKVKNVQPVYPKNAQDAGVQGTVIIEARVGPDGRVTHTRIVRSVPLLDEPALAAVRQWEFRPALLNGQPTAIIMTRTVSFTLS